ncbi:MAG: hypothetical protein MK132_24215 [Lentisphaerales bacterium]|nr:hypothetical protein [Lentisphaerales bacterium]
MRLGMKLEKGMFKRLEVDVIYNKKIAFLASKLVWIADNEAVHTLLVSSLELDRLPEFCIKNVEEIQNLTPNNTALYRANFDADTLRKIDWDHGLIIFYFNNYTENRHLATLANKIDPSYLLLKSSSTSRNDALKSLQAFKEFNGEVSETILHVYVEKVPSIFQRIFFKMNLRSILYILSLRKWLIFIPPVLTCSFAKAILLFVESVYVSSIKIWNKEIKGESSILKVARSDTQKDLHASVQREIIGSGALVETVLDETGLIKPPASNNLATKLFKLKPKEGKKSKLDPALQRITAMEALKKSVSIDVINSEVMALSAKMNSPELSLKVVNNLAKNYKIAYLRILNREIDQYEDLLEKRLSILEQELNDSEKALQAFEHTNPDLRRNPQLQTGHTKLPENIQSSLNVKAPLPSMTSSMSQVNPLTLILHEQTKLELEKSKLLTQAAPNFARLEVVNDELERNKQFLAKSLKQLSNQAKLAVTGQRLMWLVNISRERFTVLLSEIVKVNLSREAKVKQIGSTNVLNKAVKPLFPVYPKKEMTVVAAGFLAIITDHAFVYLAHLMDTSFHLEDKVEDQLGLKTLAIIPKNRARK